MQELKPTWHHTCIRVKDGKKSVEFYKKHFGFTLIHSQKLDKSTNYYLATLKQGVKSPEPGTKEAEEFLYKFDGVLLSLKHIHGTENKKEQFIYNNGNIEPNRGFGHIAVFVDDVYKTCEDLEKKGIRFKKKPDEGRMKGLAFAYDLDNYWIEIIKRDPNAGIKVPFNFSQTMIRVKDQKKSIPFYRDLLGMQLVHEKHFEAAKFSLYFMASLSKKQKAPEDTKSEQSNTFMKSLFNPIIELTHNHGTESKEGPVYHNGNVDPVGFSHVAFLVDNVNKAVELLQQKGIKVHKKPDEGDLKGIAIVLDPDSYHVHLVPRGYTLSN